jgi:hypothetical protein
MNMMSKRSMFSHNKTVIKMVSFLTLIERIIDCSQLTLKYDFVDNSFTRIMVIERAKHGKRKRMMGCW